MRALLKGYLRLGEGGAAEIADFLLLQAVNRYEPLVAHLAALAGLHAESFYRIAVEIAGELATFTGQRKRAVEFPPYRHDDLQATFAPVMGELRRSLSMVLEQNAIPIALEERKYGVRVAPIVDRALLGQASFVLAVSAKISAEEIRKRFPTQAKIGPVEGIRQLVNIQLPGIRYRYSTPAGCTPSDPLSRWFCVFRTGQEQRVLGTATQIRWVRPSSRR